MKTFVRDSTIKLKFNFRNAEGEIINPAAGAFVTISYIPYAGGTPSAVDYPLTQSGDNWIYEWDSTVSAPCIVYIHAETQDGPPISAIDAEFRLRANRSNKQLTGDY